MTDVDTELEQRLEAVLVRYGVPGILSYSDTAGLVPLADRGDLGSDLADVARAWFDEQSVSKQGKAPQPELPFFEFGRAYRNKTGGGCLYVGGSFSHDIETHPVEQLVGLSPGGALVDMSSKTPVEWEQITLDEWREQWNDPAYVNMRGPSKRPSGDVDAEYAPLVPATIVDDDVISRDEQNYVWRSTLHHVPPLLVRIIGVGSRGRLLEALADSDNVKAGERFYAEEKAWCCYERHGRLTVLEPEDEASAEHGVSAGPGWHGELIERVIFDEPVNVSGEEGFGIRLSDGETMSMHEFAEEGAHINAAGETVRGDGLDELPQGWWQRPLAADEYSTDWSTPVKVVDVDQSGAGGWIVQRDGMPGDRMFIPWSLWDEYRPTVPLSQRPTENNVEAPSQFTIEQRALLHDDKGASEEMCTRCGWVMGNPPLNCLNDNTPHVFPSQMSSVADTRDREARLRSTTDAAVWAREFIAVVERDNVIDEGFMIGWFANAIETARARQLADDRAAAQ